MNNWMLGMRVAASVKNQMRKTEITTELGLQGKVFFETKVTSGFEARQSHDLEVHIMTVLRYLLSPSSPHKGKNY